MIHACVNMTVANGQTVPDTSSPNVVLIDPSAGQHCIPPDNPAPNQSSVNWNVTGPQGAPGPAGANGTNGTNGAPNPPAPSPPVPSPPAPGSTTTVPAGHTLTLAGGEVVTVGGPALTVVTPPVQPNGHAVATLTLGSGADAITTNVLNTSFTASAAGSGATGSAARSQLHDISIVKKIDKASPKLLMACATGKHFPNATLTVRKASGRKYLLFRFKLVSVKTVAYDQSAGSTPTEAVTLSFSSQQLQYK